MLVGARHKETLGRNQLLSVQGGTAHTDLGLCYEVRGKGTVHENRPSMFCTITPCNDKQSPRGLYSTKYRQQSSIIGSQIALFWCLSLKRTGVILIVHLFIVYELYNKKSVACHCRVKGVARQEFRLRTTPTFGRYTKEGVFEDHNFCTFSRTRGTYRGLLWGWNIIRATATKRRVLRIVEHAEKP